MDLRPVLALALYQHHGVPVLCCLLSGQDVGSAILGKAQIAGQEKGLQVGVDGGFPKAPPQMEIPRSPSKTQPLERADCMVIVSTTVGYSLLPKLRGWVVSC